MSASLTDPIPAPAATPPAATPPAATPPASPAAPASPAGEAPALSLTAKPDDPAPAKPGEAEAKPPSTTPLAPGDFTLPEGFAIPPETMKRFTEAATTAKLSKESAQAMVTLYSELRAEEVTQANQEFTTQVKAWSAELATHPDLKPDPTARVRQAATVFQKYASPELTQLVEDLGLNVHPQFVAMLWRIANDFKEERVVDGGRPPKAQGSARLEYPTMAKPAAQR